MPSLTCYIIRVYLQSGSSSSSRCQVIYDNVDDRASPEPSVALISSTAVMIFDQQILRLSKYVTLSRFLALCLSILPVVYHLSQTVSPLYVTKTIPIATCESCPSSYVPLMWCSLSFFFVTAIFSIRLTIATRSSAIRRESAHLTWLYGTVQMTFQYETV